MARLEFTIKTKKLGEVSFYRPGGYYVYCDLGNPQRYGTHGNQICVGGRLLGPTVTHASNDIEYFKKLCRRWWKSYSSGIDS